MSYSLFVSCPRQLEYLLSDELKSLGLAISKTTPMGVYGTADLATLYRICLWSRLANRVQLILFQGRAESDQQLYQLCNQYHWNKVFDCDNTIAIEFHGKSSFIRNSMYGAQRVKDAVVDYFQKTGKRPSVDKIHPDIRLHAFIKHNTLTVSLDLVGYSLHQRGYRKSAGAAPLKENIAAAMLIRANWPELATKGYHLVDPFCGSGTILIEGAMIASNIAPGLLRHDQSFRHWKQHDAELWNQIRTEAENKRTSVQNTFIGYDVNQNILQIAEQNQQASNLDCDIQFKQQAIKDFHSIDGLGVIVSNPPYGERMSEVNELLPLYNDIGKALHQYCQQWQAAIITSSQKLAQAIGLRSHKQYSFYNGPLQAKLYCFEIDASNELKFAADKPLSDGAQILFNRLNKNKKHLGKWLKRKNHTCYRLYDADIPEYAFAIDIYNDWVHAQEYAAPKSIPQHKVEQRIMDMLQVLPKVLEIPADHIVLKQRKQQKGKQQYTKIDSSKQMMTVTEGTAKFYVNLHDYLDTGLFLDHRPLRSQFTELAKNTRFLNCFCYTASASVHAALAGATTTNVDLSNTYLQWAKKNFRLNQIDTNKHQFIQTDCIEWLKNCKQQFDVIFLDPPSFSNSKRMEHILDIQRDHEMLISAAMKLLSTEGKLYFSTNFKKFKLSPSLADTFQIKDITQQTLDEDFKGSRIHFCFLITHLKQQG